MTCVEVKLDLHGPHGTRMCELWIGRNRVAAEYWQNKAHAGAWCRGARDFLAGVKQNPYTDGVPTYKIGAGKRGFANAWRYGWRSARYATKQATLARADGAS